MRISDWSSDVCSSDLLAGRHYWYNPTKLASPMPWVAIRRKRVKPSVETIYWFSKSKDPKADNRRVLTRSEEHTSELQSLMRISYAVFCLKKKTTIRLNMEHLLKILY